MKNKIIIFTLFLFGLFFNSKAQDFITVWDLGLTNNSFEELYFGVETNGPVSYTWETIPASAFSGSGTFDMNMSGPPITGLIPNTKIRLKINPTNLNRIYMTIISYSELMIDVEQWGFTSWTSMADAFRGCFDLDITATDVPNLSNVENCSFMFGYCDNLVSGNSLSNWNVSNVKNMDRMFISCQNFNHPINNWDVSNVTDMGGMFSGANNFNQPINSWDVSNVTDMGGMFSGADDFNQPLNNWNVSNVTEMDRMFNYATSFNQPLGNWDLTNVHFQLEEMLTYSGINCTNLSSSLYDWAHKPNPVGGLWIGVYNRTVTSAITPELIFLTQTKGWTLNGLNVDSNNCFTPSNIENINETSPLVISPNPTNGLITLSNYNTAISKLEIVNLQGQKLIENILKDNIDISALPQGVYFLYISNEKGEKYVKKVIRE
ncbi:MAG: BspA family leucine-rich repeat surface protein [Chitinophagaceae bacterium]|nr:BspA family leucine-rich repeat surface protein [Chitinophagaceae bacterium]